MAQMDDRLPASVATTSQDKESYGMIPDTKKSMGREGKTSLDDSKRSKVGVKVAQNILQLDYSSSSDSSSNDDSDSNKAGCKRQKIS